MLFMLFTALMAGLIIGVALGPLFRKSQETESQALELLKQEFDDYKRDVNTHFDQSSTLFRDITEQYVQLYNHMSEGSNKLCDEVEGQAPRLDQLQIKTTDEIDEASEKKPSHKT